MISDPLDLRGQEQAQEAAAERAMLVRQTEVDDLKWIMSHRIGRRFVAGVIERAGVWRLSFNTNARVMAFNEGMRNEGLRLVAQIMAHCPERYAEMIKEGKDE